MTWSEALSWLRELADNERVLPRSYDKSTYGLDRAEAWSVLLGRPQDRCATVQIGGTNGKGSTAAFLESVLRHHGLRTGLTTSPHLVDVRERVRIGGRLAPRALLAEAIAEVARAREALPEEWRATATFFEAITLAAFAAFRLAGVEVAVVEVGLGGRFDATSVCSPSVVVLTSVGLDHQAFLGDTVEEIARDKSHLIRSRAPVVIGADEPARAIFRERARQCGAPVHLLHSDFAPERGFLGLNGGFQRANAACARRAAELLLRHRADPDSIRRGLAEAAWPGRFQIVEGRPPVVLDGAMNDQSARVLGAELAARYPEGVCYVLGLSADKSPEAFVAALRAEGPPILGIVACAAATPRAMPAEELAQRLRGANVSGVRAAGSVGEALALARDGSEQPVCVTGSLYVVGESLEGMGLAPFREADEEEGT